MRRPKVWARRLAAVAEAREVGAAPSDEVAALAAHAVDLATRPGVWAGLYAASGRLPDDDLVTETLRRVELEGPAAFVEALADLTTAGSARREVEVLVGATLLDVGQTATSEVRTGIQRVALELVRRWAPAHDPVLVGWTEDGDALRPLTAKEVAGLGLPADASADDGDRVVVPVGGRYLSAELNLDPESMPLLLALGHAAGMTTGVIGFDCVPITSAETAVLGVPSAFANHLAALRHMDRIVAISQAAGEEFRGWRRMLGATGIAGPEVDVVMLPGDVPADRDPQRAREMLAEGTLPTVLVVGSQEPRKNHTAVLAAADRLWREGLEFSLSLVGSQGWENKAFDAALRRLQDAGRPVATVAGVPDAALYSGYELARFTVFPSLNEGFGLPVAESLAVGTPAITSGFGSMKEIAAAGGTLLVDPRDDDDLTEAMRRLLTDDALLERLSAEALARPRRTWDEYAEEAWAALTAPRQAQDSASTAAS